MEQYLCKPQGDKACLRNEQAKNCKSKMKKTETYEIKPKIQTCTLLQPQKNMSVTAQSY